MGKLEKIKTIKKCIVINIVTIFLSLGLCVGFSIPFVFEKNENGTSGTSTTKLVKQYGLISEPNDDIKKFNGNVTIQLKCGSEVCPWTVYRLNPNILPIKYYPTIQVNITTNVYNGSVNIDVNVKEEVQYFIVHVSSILNVTQSRVYNNKGIELEIIKTFRYKPYDFWVIQLAKKVEPNYYKLYYEFNGNLLLGGLSGLYRSNYYKNKETIGLASTQFEPTYARKAFPCFDEPSFKSTFELTLIHDFHMNTTLSNMDIISNTNDESLNWVTTKYRETVPMVTYLVAIVVSDFVCKKSEIDGHDVGVCASPVRSHKLDYALEKTKSCLHHFAKDYLQVDYPLPKVDMIAIPDFSPGAMENWGLVTSRESYLLWHSNDETSMNKMNVMSTIAHELAHFWFGNLVTCKWWSHLWLNEGFATFMSYTAVNYSEPDWHYFDHFMIKEYSIAVSADSLVASPPIVRIVETPSEVAYSFSIVYGKGATVIRMLEFVMTPNNFQTGIQSYLRTHSYKTAVTQDLWDSLNQYYPKNLNTNIYQLMESWTTKAGFPYLNITRNSDNTLTVTQQRFLANGQKPVNDTLWTIPLSYYTSFDPKNETIVFINSKNQTININTDSTTNGLIKFNTDNKGMYFTNYPIEDWDKWIEALVNNQNNILEKLTPSDRANFIIDSFYLSRANFLPYVKPLQLAKYLVNERHLTPWTLAINMLSRIKDYMITTEYREHLFTYLISLAKPIYDELGWNDTKGTDTQKRLRVSIIEFICSNYHKECLESALKEYSKWKNGEKISPNLLTSTLRYAIRQSTEREDWDFLWTKYLNESSASVKLIYLNAFSYTTDANLIKTLLNRTLDSRLVRTQDVVTVLNYIAANSDGLQILWDFYKKNYQTLIDKLTTTQMGTVVNNICGYFTNDTRKSEVETFFNSNQNVGVTNSDRNRAIKTINSNINWMNARKDEVGNFLTVSYYLM